MKKNSENKNKQKSGIKEILFSICIYIFIFGMKYLTGLMTGSLTLQSDAFHSLIDSFGFLAILFGIKLANREPGEKYPFGLYKLESLLSLGISILVFYTGINFFIEAIGDFSADGGQSLTYHPLALIVPGVSIFLLLTGSYVLKRIADLTRSPTLKAEAVNVRTDAFVNLAILLGLIVAFFRFPILDLILVIVVSALIIYSGFEIFVTALKDVLDLSISVDDKEQIMEICNSEESISTIKQELADSKDQPFTLKLGNFIDSISQIRGRSSGRYVFLELPVNVDPRLSISEFSIIKRVLEKKIRTDFPNIENIVFEMVQKKPEKLNFAIPTKDKNGRKAEISTDFGEAPFFAIVTAARSGIKSIKFRENPHRQKERMKGILISEMLADWGVNSLITKKKLKKGPIIALSNYRIDMVTYETIDIIDDISFSDMF